MLSGYMHPGYAASLEEFGRPLKLPSCRGWILKRPIPGFPYHDAMGCYPLFACQDWSQLKADLDALQQELVTVALVTDPFGGFSPDDLQQCFDVVKPFKEHFIADLRQPISAVASKDHRHGARVSFRRGVEVEVIQEPIQYVDDWVSLYDGLIKRHNIKGIRAFSKASFTKQLRIPGCIMFRALHDGKTVGASVVFVQDDISYVHLSAYSNSGYKLNASRALHWHMHEFFTGKLRWHILGGGRGINDDPTDGLGQFKKGWSTGTRTAYFCGRILDHSKYKQITKVTNDSGAEYFPAYRLGEFL